jgi:trans-aconitate methyltransferase
MSEYGRLERIASWYTDEQLDMDKRLIGFRYRTIREYFVGPLGLELGPAEGAMTKYLHDHFEHLTVVEGAAALLALIPDYDNVTKVQSIFEEFAPQQPFNTIIMEHILEHVDKPVELLRRASSWLAPSGRLIAGVPNALSFHRLIAVKMGMLERPDQLNERDHALGHRRVYSPETFKEDIERAGLDVLTLGGAFFKPLSNKQIEDVWSDELIEGAYQLGKDFQRNACEIFAVCAAR